MFIVPIMLNIDIILLAITLLLIDLYSPMYPRYSRSSINSEVSLASQTHHVPHIGFPHIEPVTSVDNVNTAPMGAQDFAIMYIIFMSQIMYLSDITPMNKNINNESNAEGTCTYIILNMSFCW